MRIRSRAYELPDGTVAEWDVVGDRVSVGVLAMTDDDRFVDVAYRGLDHLALL